MGANAINRFGDSIDAIAFSWLAYQITGSAVWLAMIYAFNAIRYSVSTVCRSHR